MATRITHQTGSFSNDFNPDINIGIDLPFRLGTSGEGYFATSKTTIESIKNDIKLLLNTHHGERLYRPELGINLRKYLFEIFDVDSVINIQNDILDTIKKYLPFVEVRDIQVSMDGQDDIGKALMNVNVVFFINRDAANLQSVEFQVTSGE